MQEIVALVCNLLVTPCKFLDGFLPVLRSLHLPGHPSLERLQPLQRILEVAWICNFLAVREGREVSQPYVDPERRIGSEPGRIGSWFPIIDKNTDEPLPSGCN
ncbi:hypothetical protein DSECCO2_502230 [anaerobic digester metagenome]